MTEVLEIKFRVLGCPRDRKMTLTVDSGGCEGEEPTQAILKGVAAQERCRPEDVQITEPIRPLCGFMDLY